MADWALSGCERQELLRATASRGAANSKGSHIELTTATAFAYSAITIDIGSPVSGGGQCYLVDLSIGALFAEQVIVQDILLDVMRGSASNHVQVTLPIAVPAGSRIAARCQEVGGTGARSVEVAVTGRAGGANHPPSSGRVITYGANTATTNGVVLDSGAVAGDYGAWAEITPATTRAHKGLVAVLGANQQTASLLFGSAGFQIGIGAVGSEVVIAELASSIHGSVNRIQQSTFGIAATLPAGTRLSMRARNPSAVSPQRLTSAIILGY